MIYLFAWTVLVTQYSNKFYGWVEHGNYDTPTACHTAARNLGLKEYRCIAKGTGELK